MHDYCTVHLYSVDMPFVNNELYTYPLYILSSLCPLVHLQESVDQSTLRLRIATGTATAFAAKSAAKTSSAKDFSPTATTSCVHLVAKLKFLAHTCHISTGRLRSMSTFCLLFYLDLSRSLNSSC